MLKAKSLEILSIVVSIWPDLTIYSKKVLLKNTVNYYRSSREMTISSGERNDKVGSCGLGRPLPWRTSRYWKCLFMLCRYFCSLYGQMKLGAGRVLATPTQQPDNVFSLQGLWTLLKVLGTSQRDFHQKAGTEKSMIWKGHQGSRRKAIEHLKGFSHLGGFALWDCLMEVCILTVRKLDESIQLNVQAGHRQKWRPPCKHWYHFVRAVDVTKDRSCVLAMYKMKGRSICYNRSCHAISSPHPSLLPLSTTGKSPSNY